MKRLVIFRKIPLPNIYIQTQLLNTLKQPLIMSSSPLRILLIGRGGRESAIAWKLSQSPLVENISVVPGKPAMAFLQLITGPSRLPDSERVPRIDHAQSRC
jgi:hypothetical protein